MVPLRFLVSFLRLFCLLVLLDIRICFLLSPPFLWFLSFLFYSFVLLTFEPFCLVSLCGSCLSDSTSLPSRLNTLSFGKKKVDSHNMGIGNKRVDLGRSAASLPLRAGILDLIVTDAPFGHKCGNKREIRRLYPEVKQLLSEKTASFSPIFRSPGKFEYSLFLLFRMLAFVIILSHTFSSLCFSFNFLFRSVLSCAPYPPGLTSLRLLQ